MVLDNKTIHDVFLPRDIVVLDNKTYSKRMQLMLFLSCNFCFNSVPLFFVQFGVGDGHF